MQDRLVDSAAFAGIVAAITALVTVGAQRLLLRAQARKSDAEASKAQAEAAEVMVRTLTMVIGAMREEVERARGQGKPGA